MAEEGSHVELDASTEPASHGPLYIGVQGAAKTAVLAACDRHGDIKAALRFGPLAHRVNVSLYPDLFEAFTSLGRMLGVQSVGELSNQTAGSCVAMSGVFQEGEVFAVRQLMKDVGFEPRTETVICEDVWADLAASGHEEGAIILASTGANVFVRRGDRYVNVGGWGSELADLGSGFHVGKLAIGLVLDSADGRQAVPPVFVRAILESLHLRAPAQIVSWYHAVRRTSLWRAKIAYLAIPVVQLAERDGEPTAAKLLEQACAELLISARAALARAFRSHIIDQQLEFPIVLAGGLGISSRTYQTKVAEFLRTLPSTPTDGVPIPITWQFTVSRVHPVIGALAYALAGRLALPSSGVFRALIDSARRDRDLVTAAYEPNG
jgi:N-acetylglucosamine kinase-like BadF-type ATPase